MLTYVSVLQFMLALTKFFLNFKQRKSTRVCTFWIYFLSECFLGEAQGTAWEQCAGVSQTWETSDEGQDGDPRVFV